MWVVNDFNKFQKNVNLQKSLTKLIYFVGEVWKGWDGFLLNDLHIYGWLLIKDQYSPPLWLGYLKDPYKQEIFFTIAWDLPRIIWDQFSTFMKLWEIDLLTNTRG